MKKFYTGILFALILNTASAQSSNNINYQAIARDVVGNPIANQTISVNFTIHRGCGGCTISMTETYNTVPTNPFGLFTLAIGSANPAGFDTIAWGKNNYWLEVSIDPDAGGASPFTSMGTTQFISVPYALHAVTADSLKYSSGSNLWKKTSGNIYPYTLSDNLGIGTATPSGKLSVLTTAGNTDAFNVAQQGLGHAGVFSQSNVINDSACLISYTAGKGDAVFGINMGSKGHGGVFAVNNAASGGCGLIGSTNGKGKAVFGYQTGTGYGGVFWINNATSDSAALVGMTNGKSSAVWGLTSGIGSAGVFQSTNASSTAPGLNVSVANSAAPSAIFMGGNVGIGTTTPANKLDVSGTLRSTAQTIPTSGSGTEIIYFSGSGHVLAYDRTVSTYIPLQINGSILALNSLSGGNVGIGIANPLYSLHIKPSSATPELMLETASGCGFNTGYRIKTQCDEWLMGKENGPPSFKIKYINSGFTGFFMSTSNFIGIGTENPQAFFHVSPDKDFTYDSSFVVTSEGRVGIGTSTPIAKLTIHNGHIKSSQATAPSIGNIVLGGLTSITLDPGSTDVKGSVSTTGGLGIGSVASFKINFNMIYNAPPIVVAVPAGTGNLQMGVSVEATTASDVTISFKNNSGAAMPAPRINYIVIE
jgi:hypothetical protein